MSVPISKNMLSMSANVYSVTGMNADRKPVYGDAVELSNIWITTSTGRTEGTQGKQPSDTMEMFFDCVNSSPSDFTPIPGMKLNFLDHDYFISFVRPCFGMDGELHHYEVTLI